MAMAEATPRARRSNFDGIMQTGRRAWISRVVRVSLAVGLIADMSIRPEMQPSLT